MGTTKTIADTSQLLINFFYMKSEVTIEAVKIYIITTTLS